MGLEVRRIRATHGANVFALFPVIYGEVKLNEFEDISSKDVTGFTKKLTELFPGLNKHKCSYEFEGGFLRRLKEGTYLPHISEHLALEIQNILGLNVVYGKSIRVERDIYWVAIEYRYEETAKLALKYAFRIVETLLGGGEISRDELSTYLYDINKAFEEEKLGPSTLSLIEAAKKRKIPVLPIDPKWSMFQLGHGKKAERISATVTSRSSLLSGDIAKDKYMTKKILGAAGISTPHGYVVNSPEEAATIATKMGFPVVVKPLDSHHGKGVMGDLRNEEDVKMAFIIASKHSKNIMVEDFIEGKDYRFLVVNGKMIAAASRVPPYIVGDGKKTVKELVDILNMDPNRGAGHENYLTKVKLSEEEITYLKNQGLKVTDIVPKNVVVYLRRNANLSTGGMAEDVTEDVCPEIVKEVERAAKIIGLDVCGVDAIIKNIKKPLGKRNGGIIEINAAPGLRMHLKPSVGVKRDVGLSIINYLFPKDNGRIPIIAITGTNGKTSVTRLVGEILKRANYAVGMTTTGGIFIDGIKIISGDTTGPWSTNVVLMNKDVEVAVLEVARGGIWRRGLGYDRAYIGCVLNIRDDHIGVDGIRDREDIFWIKSVVVEAVWGDGYSVVNAMDEYAEKLLSRAKGLHALFSLEKNNVVIKELKKGSTAVYINEGHVVYENNREKEVVMPVKDILYAAGGNLKVNLENALAAILIAKLMNVDNEYVVNTLMNVKYDAFSGRMNILEYEGKKIVVDYAHNPDAILNLRDLVKELESNESWCVVAIPGDRNDDMLRANGKALASVFDHVLVTAREKDLRGRDKNDLIKKIVDGVINENGKDVVGMYDAEKAIKVAVNRARVGDVVFILLGNEVEEVKEILKSSLNRNVKINQENKGI